MSIRMEYPHFLRKVFETENLALDFDATRERPGDRGVFSDFCSVLIVASRGKLTGKRDLVCFYGFTRFLGLTGMRLPIGRLFYTVAARKFGVKKRISPLRGTMKRSAPIAKTIFERTTVMQKQQ
ncbi:MAG TPA: hypothetical protein VK596_05950 [Edaphobacter sp.]|nr:hypothetical protein [Edaphobacter sp.]